MTATINASTTAGVVTTADTSGILQLQTNGTAALTVDASQRTAFVAGTAALPAITTTGDTNTGIWFPAGDTIAFTEGGVESMRINSSGNMGIGTTTPQGRLNLSNAGAAGFEFFVNSPSAGVGTYIQSYNRSGAAYVETHYYAASHTFRTDASATTMVLNTSGNVGIGTTSPSTKLEVKKDSATAYDPATAAFNTILSLSNTTSGASNNALMSFTTESNGEWYIGGVQNAGNTAADFVFASRASGARAERMRINSSGSTFFNCTASPTSNSSGPGGLNALVSSGDVFNIKHTADGNNVFNIWQTGTASFNAITFFKGGSQTGIGQILGTTSSTAYQTSSDYRLKENITPMTGALDKVAQLKPVTYKWKVDGSDGQGFIAHELQAVVPDCVSGEKDQVNKDGSIKPQGIDTSFLVATLTAAIQELKAIVDAQGAEIAALKGATA